jgi:hypothetical protein
VSLFMPEGYGGTVPVGRSTVPEGRAQHGPRSKNLTPLDPHLARPPHRSPSLGPSSTILKKMFTLLDLCVFTVSFSMVPEGRRPRGENLTPL